MRVIIAGSRCIDEPDVVAMAIAESGFAISQLITGPARGVDAVARLWAVQRSLPVLIVGTAWNRYGGRAERIHNDQVIDLADACIAIWDGSSRGTASIIEVARERGLPLFIHQRRLRVMEPMRAL